MSLNHHSSNGRARSLFPYWRWGWPYSSAISGKSLARHALQVVLKAEDGTVVGRTRIDDLGIGIYEAGYTAPGPGEYKVHVQLVDVASKSAAVEVRGSPFRVTCSDPWTSHRVMGTVPTRNPVCLCPNANIDRGRPLYMHPLSERHQ